MDDANHAKSSRYINKNIMKKAELNEFIQNYEKLTKWMMLTMPNHADILIKIDSNQKIKKIII